jgi:hypothetical protein
MFIKKWRKTDAIFTLILENTPIIRFIPKLKKAG